MERLQLYLTIYNGKYQHLQAHDINADQGVSALITDLSPALDDIVYNSTEKHIFYMLMSTDTGVFVVVIRTIPPQRGNYFAAWIFIPYDLDITDAEITRTVQVVADAVSQSSIGNETKDRLHDIFDKQYPTIPNAGATVANHGKYYAHRYFGGDTGDSLSDLIGIRRYQTSYLKYAGVILADRTDINDITGDNLTDTALDQMVRILPPNTTDSHYSPLIFGMPFDRPFLAPLMDTVEIIWESPKAPDVSQSVMVSRPDMRIEPISAAAPRKEIPTTVTAQPEPDTVVDAATETNDVDSAPEPKSANVDRLLIYNFEIPSKSADISGMIRFALSSHNPLHDSPIDGYELSDNIQEGPTRSNHLVYVPGNNLQNNALWALGGFIIGIVLTLLCTCGRSGSSNSKDVDVASADTTAVVTTNASDSTAKADGPTPPADTSLTGAVSYLDTHPKWTKTELEYYPDLHGLYDDLNTINRQRIIDHWAPKLKDSRQFAKVVEHIQYGKHKKPVFNNPKPGQTTFNTGSDETISVRSYLNCIDH